MENGRVLNIQKYSIHDGPGIRTTVFLKGCPLDCWWCHNPESKSTFEELMFYRDRCVGCGKCVKNCSNKALRIKDGRVAYLDSTRCSFCKLCVDSCFEEAIEYKGDSLGIDKVLEEVLKDKIFYEESGGGLTVSGGEPFLQPDFLYRILRASKEKGIDTAVDTSGYTSWSNIKRVVDFVDLFLYDLKLIDDVKHKKYIGVSNKIILENLRKLSSLNKKIHIRIPVIEGINSGEEDIEEYLLFLDSLGKIDRVNLIPYHNMGKEKYERLGLKYRLEDLKAPSDKRMETIKDKFQNRNIDVKIGG